MLEVTEDTIHDLVQAWSEYVDFPNIEPRPRHVMSQWDVSQITDFDGVFVSCSDKLFTFPGNDIGGWTFGPGPITMRYMFWTCTFVPPSIAKWDVSNVVDMRYMFFVENDDDDDAMNVPLQTWNVSKVTKMTKMFAGRRRFNQPLETWDVSNVVNMHGMFDSCETFNQSLARWNVSNVVDMNYMFYGANSFNQSLASWKLHNDCIALRMLASASFANDPPVFPKNILNESAMFVFGVNGEPRAEMYRLYQQTRTTNPYLKHCSATPTVGDIARNVRAIVFPTVLELWMVDQLATTPGTMEPNLLHDTIRIEDIRRRVLEMVGVF